MITLIRSATIVPGGLASGMKYAVEIAAYTKKTLGVDTRVVVPFGGKPLQHCVGDQLRVTR
jgi:hypothetical protein